MTRFKLKGREAEVISAYLGGQPTTQIAEVFGVSTASVLQLLKKRDVPRRDAKRSHPLALVCRRGHSLAGDNLYLSPHGSRGCKTCRTMHARNPSASTLEYRKYWQIKRLYGLSREQFEAKLESQDNLCAICNQLMTKPHVDHNHRTGEVRDCLCNNCNAAVGYLHENIEAAKRLVSYLQKWKSNATIKPDDPILQPSGVWTDGR